ncbi:DUF5134 domain-containing protein [Actinocrinis sp.]|uniref:DUF5134 domain-containing protein n=1 Tax=Actinocrinis sp. TaxID=1920516 RepID=UPI002D31F584|nr:DUF5134 domain-containing protein [Actinocrinis sp.]HZP53084.1 DUF5134 domain-containing protein [Actinocrinis sp.]
MTPLVPNLARLAAPAPSLGLSMLPAAAAWPSAAVLVALAVRSAARLAADRAPADPGLPACGLTSRTGDAVHLAMAAGMVPMLVPLGVPPVALLAFFGATTAFVAGTWLRGSARRRLAAWRGAAVQCRPAHALEPHHVIVGLAMIVMAWHMDAGTSAMPGGAAMATMPGTTASADQLLVSTLALIYTWTAVVILGGGLAKAATARPLPTDPVALLAAPVTIYTCELAMTVVMGLMLLG